MITRCGLNRLRRISTFLGYHLRDSKTNPELLRALVQLDDVLYGGADLGREEKAWAVQNGIKLRVKSFSCWILIFADGALFLDLETIERFWMHRGRRCFDLRRWAWL